MKQLYLFLLLCFGAVFAWAQSEKAVDNQGNLLYKYDRQVLYIGSGTCQVTVVIVNGGQPRAVSYRQEVFRSNLTWTDTVGGEISKQDNIDIITANLAPGDSVSWKFKYENKTGKKKGIANLERSCFFFLDENNVIEKKILPEKQIKSK